MRGVGEVEARCKPLCTLDAVRVSDYNPEGKCQLPKNAGLRLDVCRCFVSPSKCQGHLVHINSGARLRKPFLRQAAWSRSIASEKYLAIPHIRDVTGRQWLLYSRAGISLPMAAKSAMGLTRKVQAIAAPSNLCHE